MRPLFSGLLLLFLAMPAVGAPSRAERLNAAFCPFQKSAAEKLFDSSFLHENSIDDVAIVFRRKASFYGKCSGVDERSSGEYEFHHEEASFLYKIDWSPQGKILEFQVGQAIVRNDNFQKIQSFTNRNFKNFSITAIKDGLELFTLRPEAPLNVSSNSRVFVLRAALRAAEEKRIARNEVLSLTKQAKSLSFGLFHRWPENGSLTVDTLINLIAQDADASASDLLLAHLGAERVEKEGKNLRPFLSHRQYALILKNGHADTESNEPIDFPEENEELVGTTGWFASTRELCKSVQDLSSEKSIFSSQRSEDEKERLRNRWEDLATFQSRGNGVSQTTLLFREKIASPWHCVAITANGTSAREDEIFSDLSSRISEIFFSQLRVRR